MEYILHLLIIIGIYSILSNSLSIPMGLGGMISLAHAAFYGIGAYSAAILSTRYQCPFPSIILISLLITSIVAFIFAVISLRTIDDYFLICTLGIQLIIFSLMNNWVSLTNGPLGISDIGTIKIFGVELTEKLHFFYLTLFISIFVYIICQYLTKSPFGRTLRALSEDEIFAQSLGKNVYLHKIVAFIIGAMLAGIAGILYAHYITYIDPSSFTVDESIFILSIVIIGGMIKQNRIIAVTIFLILLPEGLRFIGFPASIAANLRQIIYGFLLILIIIRPKFLLVR